jgi:hypothetical protein
LTSSLTCECERDFFVNIGSYPLSSFPAAFSPSTWLHLFTKPHLFGLL